MENLPPHPVLLFDGVCNLCNGFVQFIIKRDPQGVFRFASLQSELARNLLSERGLDPAAMDTVVLIDGDRTYVKSDAALRAAGYMGGAWPVLKVFGVLPRSWRNAIYDWVARNRYRWFGKKDQCMVPTPELRSRFLA
jgi:predicted DCC family thiol-disulfide oxidoreductase YuxK